MKGALSRVCRIILSLFVCVLLLGGIGMATCGCGTKEDPRSSTPADSAPGDTEPAGRPERVMLAGDNSRATRSFYLDGELAVFNWQYTAKTTFKVGLWNDRGEQVEVIADVDRKYDGSKAVAAPAGNYACVVETTASWTIVVSQYAPSDAPLLPRVFSGSSPEATEYFRSDGGPAAFQMDHQGESAFVVKLFTSEGDLVSTLADATGPYSSRQVVELEKGTFYLLDIQSVGVWAVSAEAEPAQPR